MGAEAPVVVVGASLGGLTVAETLRAEGFGGRVQLVGDETHLPYNRPPMSKQVLSGAWGEERVTLRSAAELDALDVELRLGCRAAALDLDGRRVQVQGRWQPFSELVVATGLRARPLPAAGADVPVLRTLDDVRALRPALLAARRVVVVGGGVLGQELAAVAAGTGAQVTLVHRGRALSLGTVGTLLSDRLVELHRRNGVRLRLGTATLSVEPRPAGGRRVVLDDGSTEEADLVVAAVGGAPNTAWMLGNALDLTDGVRCDEAGRAAPGLSAVGDVARWFQPATGRWERVEHQTSAIEQAVVVAGRLAGAEPGAPTVPYFWSEQHGVKVQALGTFGADDELEPAGSGEGDLLVARRLGRVRGVVGWGSPRAFRQARGWLAPD